MFLETGKEAFFPDGTSRLPFVLCGIGIQKRQNRICRPEGFRFHHLIWVTEGSGVFRCAGETRELGKGEGLFFRKGVPHEYERTQEPFSTRWITFLGADGLLDMMGVTDCLWFNVNHGQEVAADALDAMCMEGSSLLSRSAAGYTWLTELLEEKQSNGESLADEVYRFLEANYAKPLSLDEIAENVQKSRFALCHGIAAEGKEPVMVQLRQLRIAKAKALLCYGTEAVCQIGKLCGFDNASYFGMLFRRETGMTPKEYRDRHTH